MRSWGRDRDPVPDYIAYPHKHKCFGCNANTDGRVIVHTDDCPYRPSLGGNEIERNPK